MLANDDLEQSLHTLCTSKATQPGLSFLQTQRGILTAAAAAVPWAAKEAASGTD